ncbi:MAG TPA: chorismate lyase [Ideonella sp.]|nr:chorismate lyase [Ideonella sp.]
MSLRLPVRALQRAWVSAPGSLSAHLHQARPPLRVQPLREARVSLLPYELEGLREPAGTAARGREVVLWGGGQAMVLARSVVAAVHSRGVWRALRGLGSRSLAELLFSRSDVSRSAITWQWLPPRHPQVRQLARTWSRVHAQPWPGGGVWRRHSVFTRGHQPLLVAEFFAPALMRDWPRRVRHHGRCTRRRVRSTA